MKQTYFYCVMFMAVVLFGCSADNEAEKRLSQAQTLLNNRHFTAVKCMIDTINLLFPREIDVRRQALTLMRLAEKGESEQNIVFCDSLLPVRLAELEQLKKGFKFEKDPQYDNDGRYIRPEMTVERNIERSYIRCGVNEDGEMYMASVYFGAKPIEHTGLKLSLKDGAFVRTPEIPYDGGVNYRFKDNGNTTEVVNYAGVNCKEIANFVFNAPPKERIKAEYSGGKAFSLYLSDNDKNAIKATYSLAMNLTEINNLQKLKAQAVKKIQLIDAKLKNTDNKETAK